MPKLKAKPSRQAKRQRNVARKEKGEPSRRGGPRVRLSEVEKVCLGGGLYRTFRWPSR